MSRYHINPQTGNPGVCHAKKSCPFGDLQSDHYDSKEEARKGYEQQQAESMTGASKKASTQGIKETSAPWDNIEVTGQSFDEAMQEAQALAEGGKFAVVHRWLNASGEVDESDEPVEDDYEDADEYDDALADWESEREWDPDTATEVDGSYSVITYDSEEDFKTQRNSADFSYQYGSGNAIMKYDTEKDGVIESDIDIDPYNQGRGFHSTLYLVRPKG
jgi:hypothetical protein